MSRLILTLSMLASATPALAEPVRPDRGPSIPAPSALYVSVDCRVMVSSQHAGGPTTVQVRSTSATLQAGTRVTWRLTSEYVAGSARPPTAPTR